MNVPKPAALLFAALPYALSLVLLGAAFLLEEERPAYGQGFPAHTQSVEEDF